MLSEAPPGALRLRSFESTSMEESKAREKSLNGLSAWPTARFPPSPTALLYLVFSPRAPARPPRIRFLLPPLLFPVVYISSLSVDVRVAVSLSRHPSLDGRLRGQPLVNLIISAAPDKRRRQNVIPARSRSPLLISNSKRCRWLTRSYTSHRIIAGLFLPPAGLQSYSDFLPVRSTRIYRRSFVRHPSIGPLTR